MRNLNLMSLLQVAADSPAELRPSDVDRVMDQANDLGVLEEMRGWILGHADLNPRTQTLVLDWEPE